MVILEQEILYGIILLDCLYNNGSKIMGIYYLFIHPDGENQIREREDLMIYII
jgi:hypothetical protein